MKTIVKIGRWEICYTVIKGRRWWNDLVTIYTKEEVRQPKMGTFDGQRFPVGSKLTSIESGKLIIAPKGTPKDQIVGTVKPD